MSYTLHFPSEGFIVAYLKAHPLTNYPLLKEKKIIEIVAKFFANQEKYPMEVDMIVMLTMKSLNTKLGLPKKRILQIQINLSEALKDCANGERIVFKKTAKL